MLVAIVMKKFILIFPILLFVISKSRNMLKISKYYPSLNNHQNKRQCELISLITEPFSLDHHEQVPIKNHEEIVVDEQEKSE